MLRRYESSGICLNWFAYGGFCPALRKKFEEIFCSPRKNKTLQSGLYTSKFEAGITTTFNEVLEPLTIINPVFISIFKLLRPLLFPGGAARHEKVSPKTWRILGFADVPVYYSIQFINCIAQWVPTATGIYH